MGRPPKTGLDYFLCDVGWMADSKFRRLKMKYGYLAPYVYQIVLTLIYRDRGYYADAACMEELCFDILDYLHGKQMPDAETIAALVEDFTLCGLFHRELYETEHILTSRRVQKEYYNSTAKRSQMQVDKRYWLLSVEEMKAISLRSSILDLFVSDGNNGVSDGRNRVSDGKSTQRREDKNREDKNREDQIRTDKIREDQNRQDQIRTEQSGEGFVLTPEAAEICLAFQTAFSADPTEGFVREIEACLKDGVSASEIQDDIGKAARKHPKHPEAYVRSILRAVQRQRRPVHVNPETLPLEDWERDWLRGIGLPEPEQAG